MNMKPRTGSNHRLLLRFWNSSDIVEKIPIPIHHRAAQGVAVLPAHIPGVILHSVDPAVLHLLHNTYMVGEAVPLPVEEDDVARAGISLILEGASALTRACCAGRFLR